MFVSSSIVVSRIYALFVVKSTRVPRLGGGGVEPILAMPGFWELLLQPPLPYCSSCDSFTLALCTLTLTFTITSSEFAQLMLQQLRQVYTKSCNYKIANNLDYVQTSRCVHIHYVQTRHCVHIVYVQTSHSVHIHYVQTRPTFSIYHFLNYNKLWGLKGW